MTAPSEFFASCQSPTDLMSAAGVDPPSEAIACALDAMHATTPTAAQRRLWSRLSAMPWPNRRMRRVAACVGRRGLKTSGLLAWTVAYETLCVDHEAHAAPGSRIYFVVVAPRQGQAREAVRAIRAVLDSLAVLGVSYVARDMAGVPELVIESPSSRCEKVIAVMTADAVSVRGYAIAFAAIDEAAFLPSEEWLSQTDADIIRSLMPGGAQFPGMMLGMFSSPGAPQGVFHSAVTKPDKHTLVIRAPTWIANPRISEERCRELAGDEATFRQEFAAASFGYHNESFIDSAAARACLGSPYAGKGPRPGAFVIGLDVAQLADATAIVICSSFVVDVAPGHAPVRHVVVERAEVIESSRKAPTPIEAIAARVAALSKMFGGAPVLFDPFQGPTVKDALRRLGFTEHTGEGIPRGRRFVQVSMAPQHQTPRWKLVRDLAHGRRLHLPGDVGGEAVARQLAQLKATQMSTGALKIEGRRDDLADALALACEVAVRLPPTDGPSGRVEFRHDGVFWDEEGVGVRNGRWVQVTPDGRVTPAEVPEWHPTFEEHVRDCLAQGIRTPAVNRWLAAHGLEADAAQEGDPLARALLSARVING